MSADDFFAEREQKTVRVLEAWCKSFHEHLGEDGRAILEADKCAYAVGSAGRGEIGDRSDLDLFIVTNGKKTNIEQTLIQAAIIRAMKALEFPDPSNDATFLALHEADALKRQLGKPNDDPDNTFTARMLLLLESRALSQTATYDRLVEEVVSAYWRNAETHEADYLPMVLVNDIVRYWRVLLLNYEAKWAEKEREAQKTGEQVLLSEMRAKKRIASQKLRFSRCMTCYSMIARLLLAASERGGKASCHVSRDDVVGMVRESPVKRMQTVRDALANEDPEIHRSIEALLGLYRRHLELRDRPEEELRAIFGSEERKPHVEESTEFGAKVFEVIHRLGASSPLYRYVVV